MGNIKIHFVGEIKRSWEQWIEAKMAVMNRVQ